MYESELLIFCESEIFLYESEMLVENIVSVRCFSDCEILCVCDSEICRYEFDDVCLKKNIFLIVKCQSSGEGACDHEVLPGQKIRKKTKRSSTTKINSQRHIEPQASPATSFFSKTRPTAEALRQCKPTIIHGTTALWHSKLTI